MLRRDYTFIDDVVVGIGSAMVYDRTPRALLGYEPRSSYAEGFRRFAEWLHVQRPGAEPQPPL
jgi:hypothetical protein